MQGPARSVFDAAVARGADFSAWTGVALLGFPMVLTWINDSAAFFAGRAWGTKKLIPSVSPGKTVVGAIAGTLAAVVCGALIAGLVLGDAMRLPIGYLGGAVGGLLISIAAQIGDLAESLLKREAGVKDSGTFFPGHGGILDRLDALLFAIPIGYWVLLFALAS
jgi:phosphatidate cytidylyltransferase